ncbi:MAG TPA: dephospho-CoA kinase [Candidatus Megamonas gallistercoris]|nr:dephospho-CoA kinase [Candidatus Megamonas gallistercoris]
MRIIGLTGGIACGKSTVSAYLKQRGAVIIDGDEIARELSKPHKAIWQAYVNHFGMKVLNDDNSLNRRLIGRIVFTDEQEKNWMNATMHPLIKEAIMNEIEKCRQNRVKVVVLDIPLLYEAGWDKFADEVWVVKITRQLQIERIQNRDKLTRQEAESRIDAQMSLEKKAEKADVVIDSSGTPEITLAKVARICEERNLDL